MPLWIADAIHCGFIGTSRKAVNQTRKERRLMLLLKSWVGCPVCLTFTVGHQFSKGQKTVATAYEWW
jgi:hypothetical protein